MTAEVIVEIEQKIRLDWSPEQQVSGTLEITISHDAFISISGQISCVAVRCISIFDKATRNAKSDCPTLKLNVKQLNAAFNKVP